jgi:hypothetical protein
MSSSPDGPGSSPGISQGTLSTDLQLRPHVHADKRIRLKCRWQKQIPLMARLSQAARVAVGPHLEVQETGRSTARIDAIDP